MNTDFEQRIKVLESEIPTLKKELRKEIKDNIKNLNAEIKARSEIAGKLIKEIDNKTDEINNDLSTKIFARELITDDLTRNINSKITKIEDDLDDINFDADFFNDKIVELSKIEKDLVSYSLRIVATIVSLLGIILTITYVFINNSIPHNFLWFCYGIILFFGIILSLWFYIYVSEKTNLNNSIIAFFLIAGIAICSTFIFKIHPFNALLGLSFIFGLILIIYSTSNLINQQDSYSLNKKTSSNEDT